MLLGLRLCGSYNSVSAAHLCQARLYIYLKEVLPHLRATSTWAALSYSAISVQMKNLTHRLKMHQCVEALDCSPDVQAPSFHR